MCIVALAEARDLKFEVLLVRPEPGAVFGWAGQAEDRRGDQLALLDGVVDALETSRATIMHEGAAGAVAGCEHLRVRGAPVTVHQDTVRAGDARVLGQLLVREDADAG